MEAVVEGLELLVDVLVEQEVGVQTHILWGRRRKNCW